MKRKKPVLAHYPSLWSAAAGRAAAQSNGRRGPIEEFESRVHVSGTTAGMPSAVAFTGKIHHIRVGEDEDEHMPLIEAN